MHKIGVIGLGLIGGSIFRELQSLNHDVIGISNSQSGEFIFKDYEKLKDRDLIFVCTPMNKTEETLDKLESYLNSYTVVTDVCSLKEFLINKERPFNFIPSHPMAGTEHSGFENSFIGLFKNAKWAITPIKEKSELLEKIIKELGATPIYTTAKAHDEAVALISHMPMVLSQALFLAASDNSLALELASSGFRDMTRLALSSEEMANDMVNLNSKNIEHSILRLYSAMGTLMKENYPEKISKIKSLRSKMFL